MTVLVDSLGRVIETGGTAFVPGGGATMADPAAVWPGQIGLTTYSFGWDGTTSSATATGTMSGGSTSATLTAPFSGLTDTNYVLEFTNGNILERHTGGNLTNGSTAISWSGGLGFVAISSIKVIWNHINIYRNGSLLRSNQVQDPFGNTMGGYMDGCPPSTALTPNTTYTYVVKSFNPATSAESPGITIGPITTLATGAAALPTAPTNPDSWIVPPSLPTGGTTWTCTVLTPGDTAGTGPGGSVNCSLQHAINGYAPGDVIVLTAGATYDTGASAGYFWPQVSNPSNKWTYIVSSQAKEYIGAGGTLPAYSYNTNLGAGISNLSSGAGGNWVHNTDTGSMAQIQCSVVNGVSLTLNQGANYLRFIGIWFCPPLTNGTMTLAVTAIPSTGATSATLTAGFPGVTNTSGFWLIFFPSGETRSVNMTNGSTAVNWSPGLGYTQSSANLQFMFTGWANQYCVQMTFPTIGSPSPTPANNIAFDRCMTGCDPTQIFASSGYSFSRYGFHVNCNNLLIHQCYCQGHSDTWDGLSSQAATFTAGPGIGAGGATLTTNWGTNPNGQNQGSGTFRFVFSSGEVRDTVCTSGNASVTWSPNLTIAATTAANFILPQLTGYPVNESHAIFGHGGQNVCVQNSYLSAVTECWFTGGVEIDPLNPPRDWTCRYNWLGKDSTWFTNSSGADFKNIMEHKAINRIEVYGSVFSYCAMAFVQSQRGRCFVFWANDQMGNNGWVQGTDVNVHDNLILHTGGMAYPSGPTGGVTAQNGGVYWTQCARMRFVNNLCYLDVPDLSAIGNTSTQPFCTHLAFNVPDQIWDHNTYIVNSSNAFWSQAQNYGVYGYFNNGISVFNYASDGFTPNGRQIYSDRITITNNVFDAGNAFTGGGLGHGASTFSTLFPNTPTSGLVDYNLYTGSSPDATSYSTNDKPNVVYASCGFANFVNNTTFPANPHDWVITSGTYATAASDGGPIGFRGYYFVSTTSPLPNATHSVAYSTTLATTGATGAQTWTMTSCTPNTGNWLSVTNSATGAIGGTPGAGIAGEIEIATFSVTDSATPPRTITKT